MTNIISQILFGNEDESSRSELGSWAGAPCAADADATSPEGRGRSGVARKKSIREKIA